MKRVTEGSSAPATATSYNLYYRGKLLLSDTTRAECIGEKNRLLNTGSYLKEHFSITPIEKP